MRPHALALIVGAALLLGLALTACGQPAPTPTATPTATATRVPATPTATPVPPTPTTTSGTGTVEVRVTDKPPEGVTNVKVTVSKIEAQRSGAEGESGWSTIVETPPVFDLVAVTGLEEVLGSRALPQGTYTQVRLDVTKVVVTIQGQDKEAIVPSDKLLVVGNFQVAADKTTVLTLDFDADKSVVLAGDRVQFKPVLKLLTQQPVDKPVPAKKGIVIPLAEVGGSNQSGVAILAAKGDETEVTIDIKAAAAGISQPAHIHDMVAQGDKDCALPPKVKHTLTNVVDGKSITVVKATLASLQSQPFAICVHKSVPEVTTYVAAGVIPLATTGVAAPTPTKEPAAATPTTFQATIKNITLLDITIPVGTTLTWVNEDTVPHILASGKDGKFDSVGWNSPNLIPGISFSRLFGSAGTIPYTCLIHPTLNATVTVAQAGTPSSSTPASSGDTSGSSGSDYYY